MLTFHNISFRNFLSYGNYTTTVKLDDVKRTIIIAKNGSGKSSMFDAIVFALFGRPYRRINKPNLVNSINGKGLLTEIEFSVNDTGGKKLYKVRRGIKPAIFEIYVNGNKLDEVDSSRDQQKYLEENILKTNFRTFTQIVILGSGNYVPFMHLTSAQRREFIENLLDIDIFSSMNLLLKGRYSILKELRTITDQKMMSSKEKIQLQRQMIRRLESQRTEEQESVQSEIDELTEYLTGEETVKSEIEQEMNLIQQKLSEYEGPKKLKNAKDGTQENMLEAKSEFVRIQKSRKFMETNTSCPTCKQNIEDAHRHSFIEKYDHEMEEQKRLHDQRNKEYEELRKRLEEVESLNKEYFQAQTNLRGSEVNIEKYKREIEAKQNRQSLVKEEDIQDEQEKLERLEAERDTLKERQQYLVDKNALYDSAYDLLKDNGIKSRIISQYIPILNKLINQYLAEMNFAVTFTLDETFNEQILSRYRDSFTYDNFSNGEKMRIDIALLMVWRNLAEMKNSIHTNILLMDEVFDSSLDEDGVDDFLKILETVTKTNNIFIISHKPGFDEKFDQLIAVEKHNDFSYLDIRK